MLVQINIIKLQYFSYDLTAMETNSKQRMNYLRRLQLAKSKAASLNRMKAQNNSGQFSSRRGTLPQDSVNRRIQRRNQFRKPSDVRGYNGNNRPQRNSNTLQKALLKRQQMRRQQHLRNRQKINSSGMKIGASSVSRNGEQYPPRYNRRLNQRGDYDAPSYDSPPNVMQNHYDREYSNTFNEPFPSPHKKPFEPPNIFTQGHPGETRYWEGSYDDKSNTDRVSGHGK